jgi:hypothetical protein
MLTTHRSSGIDAAKLNLVKRRITMATMTTMTREETNKTTARVEASSKRKLVTNSRMMYSRLIGALFLLGFLSYGGGFSLVASLTAAPDFLSTIPAHQTLLITGAFLMLLNTLVDVAKGVLFFPILEKHGKRTALAYLAAMIIEVVLLTAGVLALLTIAPLAQQAVDAGQASAGWAGALGSLAVQSNAMAYNIGEISLGVGAIFLCALMLRTRLVPGWLSISGLIGYPILIAGCVAEIFGIHIGTLCTIPGMFFELALPFWLMIKGFNPEAYGDATDAGAAAAPATL